MIVLRVQAYNDLKKLRDTINRTKYKQIRKYYKHTMWFSNFLVGLVVPQ